MVEASTEVNITTSDPDVEVELACIRQRITKDQQAIRQGRIPRNWRAFAICKSCGPVLLIGETGTDYGLVPTCPWCSVRATLGKIPNIELVHRLSGREGPMITQIPTQVSAVRCGDCDSFLPDQIGDGNGIGECRDGVVPGPMDPIHWAWASRHCADFKPKGTRLKS